MREIPTVLCGEGLMRYFWERKADNVPETVSYNHTVSNNVFGGLQSVLPKSLIMLDATQISGLVFHCIPNASGCLNEGKRARYDRDSILVRGDMS